MFKGIHNEAEFYTNFYFDNKLSSDLQSKVASFTDIKDKTDKLKGLESYYWSYRDAKPSNEGLLEFYQKLLTLLGYQFDLKVVDTLKETSFNSIAQVHADERTNLYIFLTNEIEEGTFETPPLALNIAENPETRELSEVISEFFDELENPPKWILVGSPTTIFLLERNKWAFGKYIKFNWDEIFQQKTDDLYSSILGLISKESLCPQSGQSIHAEMDDNSHRHAFEVTTELRESVRESIELLINEMIFQKKEKHQAYLSKVDSNLYAKELSHDALFYAYRLIFLLFLEAQAEDSELLPLKSEIYRHGYSLEKLLELIHDIPDEKTTDFEGSFVFESLQQIFNLIYNGFNYKAEKDLLTDTTITNSGFLLKGLKSELFSPEAVKHLKDIKLRNGVMLTILRKLSLSSKGTGKNKRLTRVSYSHLGINQLGAVYESLLSYSGFFAQENLHALKPSSVKQSDIENGKELDQIYLAPKSIVDKYTSPKEKKYQLKDDNFVLGEDGNRKVYKKGTFVYRLAGRDRQKLASFYTPESLTKCTVKYSLKVLFENKKTLEDLWSVKILEPAMGSGAFLNEAVNQIAERIHSLEYPQKLKEIEENRAIDNKNKDERLKLLRSSKGRQKLLSEIKYKLITNNVFGVDLNPVAVELARFSLWLNCIGADKAPPNFEGKFKIGNSLVGARFKKGADGIFPWLLLDEGMGNYDKTIKLYDASIFDRMKEFKKKFFSSKLEGRSQKVQDLQKKAEILLSELINSKDKAGKNRSYQRLKNCGDLWCSAFFLTPEDLPCFPSTHSEFLDILDSLLSGYEVDEKIKAIFSEKYEVERFFHWEIEFPEIFFDGGVDLILGNPPWKALEWNESQYLTDINVLPVVLGTNAAETRAFIKKLSDSSIDSFLSREFIRFSGYSNLLDVPFYSSMKGSAKNTYKAFDILCFYLLSSHGSVGLIHEDGVLEERSSSLLREVFYSRLVFHFDFINEKYLFAEVNHNQRFSINVFAGEPRVNNSFLHIGNCFLAKTVDESLDFYNGNPSSLAVPGIKDHKHWETRGHQERVIRITPDELASFKKLLRTEGVPTFLSLHSNSLRSFIIELSKCTRDTVGFVGVENCVARDMLHETSAQDDQIIKECGERAESYEEVIYSGPNLFSLNPYFQQTKTPFVNKSSYEIIDLENISNDFIPRTQYQLLIRPEELDPLLPTLSGKKYRSFYRLASRGMINPSRVRCLFTAIIPPGTIHINGVKSIAIADSRKLLICAGLFSSLIYDAILRLQNKDNFYCEDFKYFPIPNNESYFDSIARRALSMNGVTKAYDQLWVDYKAAPSVNEIKDFTIFNKELVGYGTDSSSRTIFKSPKERELVAIEIDALVALSFGISIESLIQVYQTLFPVLQGYDLVNDFDRGGHFRSAYSYFQKRGW